MLACAEQNGASAADRERTAVQTQDAARARRKGGRTHAPLTLRAPHAAVCGACLVGVPGVPPHLRGALLAAAANAFDIAFII